MLAEDGAQVTDELETLFGADDVILQREHALLLEVFTPEAHPLEHRVERGTLFPGRTEDESGALEDEVVRMDPDALERLCDRLLRHRGIRLFHRLGPLAAERHHLEGGFAGLLAEADRLDVLFLQGSDPGQLHENVGPPPQVVHLELIGEVALRSALPLQDHLPGAVDLP